VINSWTGENDWTHYHALVTAGINTFTWVYERGSEDNSSENRVWIDQIGFPTITRHIIYPPENLTATVNNRDITLTWEAPFKSHMAHLEPLNFLGHNLLQSGLQVNSELIQGTSFTIYNSAGGNLPFTVFAVYEEGTSIVSNTVILPLPIGVPKNLHAELEENGVRLTWDWDYNAFNLLGFRVIRNGVIITPAPGLPTEKTFLDTNFPNAQDYTYQVRAVIVNPVGMSAPSNEVTIFVVDCGDCVQPTITTALGDNFPNPFNPYTTIEFGVRNSEFGSEFVNITIYNVRGQVVKTLVNDNFVAGSHSVVWNGRDDRDNPVGSGIYFYRMTTEDFQETRKMMLLK